MAKPFSQTLTPERALIFRITHRANLPWILENGLHCQSAAASDSNFVSIGNPELIDRRRGRPVTIPPGGTLNDYVPFYFTPYSPMLYNIRTGYAGIPQRKNEEIAVLVSSLPVLKRTVLHTFSPTVMPIFKRQVFSARRMTSRRRSTFLCSRAGTSAVTPTILRSSIVTRRRRWPIATCLSVRFWALAATLRASKTRSRPPVPILEWT